RWATRAWSRSFSTPSRKVLRRTPTPPRSSRTAPSRWAARTAAASPRASTVSRSTSGTPTPSSTGWESGSEPTPHPSKSTSQGRAGRLRLLSPRGTVHELTWGRPLPGGGILIDVQGPSVTPDGRRVLFAGRRADDHGHFRLYEIHPDGTGLRPLTGGPDDPGC